MRHHDLIVIGSGSGNSFLDARFEHLDVALIEHGTFGGTCLNVGCIPTKMFVHPADLARAVRRAGHLGVDATVDKVRWTDIRDRVFGRIDPISAAGRHYRADRCRHITLYEGHARFTGPRELHVEGPDVALTADQIVVAAGSRPTVPAVVAESGVPFHTSDTVMRIETLPERLVILGSGYIAAEFAHVFSAFGCAVSVVGRSSPMLRGQDETIAERFTALAHDRWDVHLGAEPVRVRRDGDEVVLDLADGTVVRGDLLLVATGRRPNGDRLDLPAAGIPTHPDGRIVVDEHQRTPADGVFAMGDVSSPFQLKHVANHESRVVAHNLLHPDTPQKTDHRFVPAAVFTEPQIATVGRTEQVLPGRRPGLRSARAGLRRRRVRVGDGRRHRLLQGARRARHREAAGRSHPGAGRLGGDPAADPGHVVRADGDRDGVRAVLDPPGPARAGGERAARAAPVADRS